MVLNGYLGKKSCAVILSPDTVIAPSLCGFCIKHARVPYDFHVESASAARQLHRQPHYGFALPVANRNCMIPVYNVNAYAIARSYLRCLKNCMENRRLIYCTATTANVN